MTAHPRPTGSRVHRYTKTMAGQEGSWYRAINRRNARRYMSAARQYDRAGRLEQRRGRTNKKVGHLGHIALEALHEMLFYFMDRATGQLDPAYATIAERIGHSTSAVYAAVQRLRQHGFLAWLRRYVPTEQEGLRGPQVRQTSNAYQLLLPRKLAARMTDPPLPVDDAHRRQDDARETSRMLTSLPLAELPGVIVTDPDLAAVLARVGRLVEEAERGSA